MAKRQITTMCPMNCHPTYCGMTVELEDDRLVTIKGDLQNPDSRGFLCLRGRSAHEIINNPRRLHSPLRRVGRRGEDAWEPCSWEEALTLIVEAIQQTRRDRVGIWPGHGSLVTGVNRPLLMRFGYLGGFQVWNPAIVCWALGAYGLGLTGILEANTKEDMAANSRTILFWGSNLASQPTTAPHLIAARKRGACHSYQAFAPLAQNRWHFSPTEANGCPAFAVHRAAGSGGPSRAFGIQIVTLEVGASGLRIADVTTFLDPWFVTYFGFPHELPA